MMRDGRIRSDCLTKLTQPDLTCALQASLAGLEGHPVRVCEPQHKRGSTTQLHMRAAN